MLFSVIDFWSIWGRFEVDFRSILDPQIDPKIYNKIELKTNHNFNDFSKILKVISQRIFVQQIITNLSKYVETWTPNHEKQKRKTSKMYCILQHNRDLGYLMLCWSIDESIRNNLQKRC